MGNYTIHFRRNEGGQWSKVKKLSSSTGSQNILPTVGSDNQGNVWVAWTQLEGVSGKIRYCFLSDDRWHGPATIETPTSSDMAPSLVLTDTGEPWLAFSGSDGKQDDIYAVHWAGERWSHPVRVNREDDTPDVLPVMTIGSSGQPVVQWQGYHEGRYVRFSSQWDGDAWTTEQELIGTKKEPVDRTSQLSAMVERENILQTLPEVLKDTSQAVLLRHRNGKRETIRLKKRH